MANPPKSSPAELAVLCAVAMSADVNGETDIALSKLSKGTGLSVRAVSRAIKGLLLAKRIERENRTGGRGNKAVVRLIGFANALS